jgi:proline iminopeptidase
MMLDVGGGHRLYYEVSGNPNGIPAVFLHGGPGGGLNPLMRDYFNPQKYKVILFDQRGCGKSTPSCGLENNNIEELVEDVENLRLHLGIDKWVVLGASWGSALAMLYAGKYPDGISALILSGIFFADSRGRDYLTEEGGASRFQPALFANYRDFIRPEKRKQSLAQAYYDIMIDGTEDERMEAVRRFILYDVLLLKEIVPESEIADIRNYPDKSYPLCRIYFHFAVNFYDDANRFKILKYARSLSESGLPCAIFHGEKDYVCPVSDAKELHEAYPGSELHILPNLWHSMRNPGYKKAVLDHTNKLAQGLTN